jgi:hypothetical protein
MATAVAPVAAAVHQAILAMCLQVALVRLDKAMMAVLIKEKQATHKAVAVAGQAQPPLIPWTVEQDCLRQLLELPHFMLEVAEVLVTAGMGLAAQVVVVMVG